MSVWGICNRRCPIQSEWQLLYLTPEVTLFFQRKRGGKEKPGKGRTAKKVASEPDSDAESDDYGGDGLSWEAVLATVQVRYQTPRDPTILIHPLVSYNSCTDPAKLGNGPTAIQHGQEITLR